MRTMRTTRTTRAMRFFSSGRRMGPAAAAGRAVAFGPAEPSRQAAAADPRIVAATLSLFIRNVRAVSSDGVVQRELLYRAYAHAAAKARQFLDSWFALPEHDPRVVGQRCTRS